MKTDEFIKKWNVGYESLERKAEFAAEMKRDLEAVIAYHEQSQWKPYPENKPEYGKTYIVQTKIGTIGSFSYHEQKLWETIICYRELPKLLKL